MRLQYIFILLFALLSATQITHGDGAKARFLKHVNKIRNSRNEHGKDHHQSQSDLPHKEDAHKAPANGASRFLELLRHGKIATKQDHAEHHQSQQQQHRQQQQHQPRTRRQLKRRSSPHQQHPLSHPDANRFHTLHTQAHINHSLPFPSLLLKKSNLSTLTNATASKAANNETDAAKSSILITSPLLQKLQKAKQMIKNYEVSYKKSMRTSAAVNEGMSVLSSSKDEMMDVSLVQSQTKTHTSDLYSSPLPSSSSPSSSVSAQDAATLLRIQQAYAKVDRYFQKELERLKPAFLAKESAERRGLPSNTTHIPSNNTSTQTPKKVYFDHDTFERTAIDENGGGGKADLWVRSPSSSVSSSFSSSSPSSSSSSSPASRSASGSPFIDCDNDAYAGDCSLNLKNHEGVHFDFDGAHNVGLGDAAVSSSSSASRGYYVRDYPYMCAAFKLSPDSQNANMLLQIRPSSSSTAGKQVDNNDDETVWRSILIEDHDDSTCIKYPSIASFASGGVIADGNWHYACIDLQRQLDGDVGAGSQVISVAWGGLDSSDSDTECKQRGDVWLDSFSIATSTDCKGSFSAWSDCSAKRCSQRGTRTRVFSITTPALAGGDQCVAVDGEKQQEDCLMDACVEPSVLLKGAEGVNGDGFNFTFELQGAEEGATVYYMLTEVKEEADPASNGSGGDGGGPNGEKDRLSDGLVVDDEKERKEEEPNFKDIKEGVGAVRGGDGCCTLFSMTSSHNNRINSHQVQCSLKHGHSYKLWVASDSDGYGLDGDVAYPRALTIKVPLNERNVVSAQSRSIQTASCVTVMMAGDASMDGEWTRVSQWEWEHTLADEHKSKVRLSRQNALNRIFWWKIMTYPQPISLASCVDDAERPELIDTGKCTSHDPRINFTSIEFVAGCAADGGRVEVLNDDFESDAVTTVERTLSIVPSHWSAGNASAIAVITSRNDDGRASNSAQATGVYVSKQGLIGGASADNYVGIIADVAKGGYLEQQISRLVPGINYQLSFLAAAPSLSPSSLVSSLRVLVDDKVVVPSFQPSAGAFVPIRALFTSETETVILRFENVVDVSKTKDNRKVAETLKDGPTASDESVSTKRENGMKKETEKETVSLSSPVYVDAVQVTQYANLEEHTHISDRDTSENLVFFLDTGAKVVNSIADPSPTVDGNTAVGIAGDDIVVLS